MCWIRETTCKFQCSPLKNLIKQLIVFAMYFLYERCAGNKEVCFPFRLIKNKVETDSILLSLVSKEDDSS